MVNPADQAGNVPPHDQGAEQYVIAAMIVDPACIPEVQALIPDSGMFWRTMHQHVYEALLTLAREDVDPDWVSVTDAVLRAGKIDDCGGREHLDAWLRSICHNLPSSYGVEIHAGIVRDRAIRRRAIMLAGDVRNTAMLPTGTGVDVAAKAAADFEKLLDVGIVAKDSPATGAVDAVIGAMAKGGAPAVSTGYAELDRYGEFVLSGLYVIGARTGEGKSTLIANFAERMQARGIPFGVVSVEMTTAQMTVSIAGVRSGVNRRRIFKNDMGDDQRARVGEALESLRTGWRITDTEGMTVEDIEAQAVRWAREHDIKVLFVDHLQRVKATDSRQPRHLQVGHITWALKGLARRLNIVVVLAVQINREGAKEGAPKLHHMKESGSVEEDADGVLVNYVDRAKNEKDALNWDIEVQWIKNRHGPLGTMQARFEKASGRILPLDNRPGPQDFGDPGHNRKDLQ
jgi:replicative DNA helicase